MYCIALCSDEIGPLTTLFFRLKRTQHEQIKIITAMFAPKAINIRAASGDIRFRTSGGIGGTVGGPCSNPEAEPEAEPESGDSLSSPLEPSPWPELEPEADGT